MKKDRMAEPLHGQRVPYVVVNVGPGARLVDCAVRLPLSLPAPFALLCTY